MAIQVGSTNITSVIVDGVSINIVKDSNNNNLWARPYTLTIDTTNMRGYYGSTSINRTSTYEPSASTGSTTIYTTTYPIYYGDVISVTVHCSISGPTITNNTYSGTVSGNITIAPVVTIPTAVNITCYNCAVTSADDFIHNQEYDFTVQGNTSYSTMYGTQYSYLVKGSGSNKSIRNMVGCSIIGQTLSPVGGIADRELFTILNVTGSSPSLSVYATYKPVVLKAVKRSIDSYYNISSNQNIPGRTYSYDQDENSSDGWVDVYGVFHYYIVVIYPNGTITSVTGGSTTPTLRTSSEVRNIIYNRTSLADPYTYDCQCAIYECTTPANGSRIITHTITASNFSTDTVTFVANIVREGDPD